MPDSFVSSPDKTPIEASRLFVSLPVQKTLSFSEKCRKKMLIQNPKIGFVILVFLSAFFGCDTGGSKPITPPTNIPTVVESPSLQTTTDTVPATESSALNPPAPDTPPNSTAQATVVTGPISENVTGAPLTVSNATTIPIEIGRAHV